MTIKDKNNNRRAGQRIVLLFVLIVLIFAEKILIELIIESHGFEGRKKSNNVRV